MRKKLVIALTVATMMGTMTPMAVYAEQTTAEEGMTVDNPWSNLFEETSKNGNETTKNGSETATNKDSETTKKTGESDKKTENGSGTSNGTIGRVRIVKKIKKKKTAKKIKISVKPLQSVNGYQVCVFKTKTAAKKGKKALYTKAILKNTKVLKVSNKKLAKKKKLFVKVRAFKVVNGKRVFGPWSKIAKVKVK